MRAVVPVVLLAALLSARPAAWAQDTVAVRPVGEHVAIRFREAELKHVIQALGQYLPKPLVIGDVPATRVTLETPVPVPTSQVLPLLRGLAEAHDLELVEQPAFYRVARRGAARRSAAEGQAPPGPPLELFVIRLKHARAADVAATVNLLFGGAGAFAGPAGFSTGTLSDELRRTAAQTLQRQQGQEGPKGQEPKGAELAGPVTIVPDALTNALLVRAAREDFAVIRQAVEQLDVRPLQVLIQVLIVEVRRDRAFSLGVDAAVEDVEIPGGGTLSGFLLGGGLGAFVLQVMNLGRYELDATLRAAVARGDARIVSRPVVVASNNREARILVGAQRPFIQVSRSLPTDVAVRDQVVQYRDVGTKLTVVPTINADGYVSLVIRQEVNSATAEVQFDAPVIATREAETTVLVKDGQTVVLGGLRERQQEVVRSGIPLLSALPVVGGLFGAEERRTTETELFLFITPVVLADDASAAAAAARALEDARRAGVKLPPQPERR